MTTALTVPARTALAHIDKGKKCFTEADELISERELQIKRLQSRGEDHFISAGKLFAKIKDDHNTSTEGAWGSVCKKKCGLQETWVNFYIRVSEGRADARDYNKKQAARKRIGRKAGSTGENTTGQNSQDETVDLACHRDPRIDRRSKLLNEILEGVRLAKECAAADLSDLFDFRPLANAADQAAKQWEKVAEKLRRHADEKTPHKKFA